MKPFLLTLSLLACTICCGQLPQQKVALQASKHPTLSSQRSYRSNLLLETFNGSQTDGTHATYDNAGWVYSAGTGTYESITSPGGIPESTGNAIRIIESSTHESAYIPITSRTNISFSFWVRLGATSGNSTIASCGIAEIVQNNADLKLNAASFGATLSANTWYLIGIRAFKNATSYAEIRDSNLSLITSTTVTAYNVSCTAIGIGKSSGFVTGNYTYEYLCADSDSSKYTYE